MKVYPVQDQNMPLFVREGAIIPKRDYSLSTFTLDPAVLNLHVYVGQDGQFELYEDDGVTEKFNTQSESLRTQITYSQKEKKLDI